MVVDDAVLLGLAPEHSSDRVDPLPRGLPSRTQCELALFGLEPLEIEGMGLLVRVGRVEIGGQHQPKSGGGQERLQRLVFPV